jgi:hypothetical protein
MNRSQEKSSQFTQELLRGKTDTDVPPTPDHPPTDPLPNPEPAAPSLDQPDPGVFHRVPVKPPPY